MELDNLKLVSARLILKPLSLDYKIEVFEELTSEIAIYMYPKPCDSLEETDRFIRDTIRQRRNGTDLNCVILKRDDHIFLGVCGIHNIHTVTPEFGIWLRKSAHGNGYGREAIHLLKQWADENLEYVYLSYSADKDNIPSRKIAESLGGRIARQFRLLSLSGNLLNLLEYRIDNR